MERKTVALGISGFADVIERDVFYVDKTHFIKEWWNNKDTATLITRPRRFGKTLTLSMIETFFSNQYADRGDLFEGLSIWKDDTFRQMQGIWPVINVSFANVKQTSYASMTEKMKSILAGLYLKHSYILKSDKLEAPEKVKFMSIMSETASDETYMSALLHLADYMHSYYGRKVLILIDEYDTPMLEAYVNGYWEEAIVYIRRLFHAAFKDNPHLERGLMTGITRITQESIFSDLNNLRVVTTTSNRYSTCFGFTEEEVFEALETYGFQEQRDEVKRWYDGFQFGDTSDIYNPWSILNYLSTDRFEPYWMNTSGNALVGKLVQQGSIQVKKEFQAMLQGDTILTDIDESITYAELKSDSKTIWSWLLTTGYVKIAARHAEQYEITLTNYEVRTAFYKLISKWFDDSYEEYTDFIRMLLENRVEEMQYYLSGVAETTFSYFDIGNRTRESQKAEQFYHGFTLGLIADLRRTHIVTSNRESGFGRYDVCIEPLDHTKPGILIEFKVFDPKEEQTLEETAQRALHQIEEKKYETDLRMRGIKKICKYGFAFRGKEVLIAEGNSRK